ncbi:MAG: CDP-2,3-bis-(O-geranylgeranyl)-sn-glycerol synthase [Candidatus Odinarchaeota archaeon]|nr:CDP-2,3-bis-(O-geranylgeranyl)-sn-glycerol synthase [Candidatus Odinarchaeota archaeon]
MLPLWLEILLALWFILPAYVANAFAVIFSGGPPIDFGRFFIDGKRIFGDGKTVGGFVGGVIIGIIVSGIQAMSSLHILKLIAIYYVIDIYVAFLIKSSLLRGFLLSFGAMFGDLIGSFVKRRFGLRRGAPAPLLDQLDFLLGAMLFANLIGPLQLKYVIILLIITPIIHLSSNIIGYMFKLKKEPW